MKFALLASGSKGNAFLLQEDNTTILIDCGSTWKYLKASLAELHQEVEDMDALLITHDHSDHISQIRHFSELPIYAPVEIDDVESFHVQPMKEFSIGCFDIYPVALSHDAPCTTGYIITDGKEKLVYVTDTGYVKETYFDKMKGADYIVMESNHDVEMLMHTYRPQYLKQRIYGDQGHLNNEDCSDILNAIITNKTKVVLLAHISQEANTREKALETTCERLKERVDLNEQLVIAAAGQFEKIIKGESNEEMDMGTCYRNLGMECHS